MRRRDPAAQEAPPPGFDLARWAEGRGPAFDADPDEHRAYRVRAYMRYLASKYGNRRAA